MMATHFSATYREVQKKDPTGLPLRVWFWRRFRQVEQELALTQSVLSAVLDHLSETSAHADRETVLGQALADSDTAAVDISWFRSTDT